MGRLVPFGEVSPAVLTRASLRKMDHGLEGFGAFPGTKSNLRTGLCSREK